MDSKNESLKNDQAEENLENKQTEAPADFQYTKDDFYTTAPYDYLYGLSNFEQQIMLEKLAAYAKEKGVGNFKTLWASYKKGKEGKKKEYKKSDDSVNNVLRVDGLDKNLNCGKWHVTEEGIFLHGELVCHYPIIPYEIIKDIDDEKESYRLLYWLNQTEGQLSQREVVVPADTLSNAKNVVKLADLGIGIVSGNPAQLMVQYFRDLVALNRPQLKHTSSVSHLGWSKYNTFTPYDENILYVGDEDFNDSFKALKEPKGDYNIWRDEVITCMSNSKEIQIVVGASFASVLLAKLGILSFYAHLWSPRSGSGKTVGIMIAASVWGNPSLEGGYIKDFHSSQIALEAIAGFLNSIPLPVDETQLIDKDSKGNKRFNQYDLVSGVSSAKGTKSGGLRKTKHWCNCIITSGETPMVQDNDGAGALNRVLEIKCDPDKDIVVDGNHTANIMCDNYGFAGRMFVEEIMKKGVLDELKETYRNYQRQLIENHISNKQAMSAAAVLTAFDMACRCIFIGFEPMTVDDILPYLRTNEEVDIADRGYDYICSWVSGNRGNFIKDGEMSYANLISSSNNPVYGKIEKEWIYINRNYWEEACKKGGYDPNALLAALAVKDKAWRKNNKSTYYVNKKLNGITAKCVKIRPSYKDEDDEDKEDK